MNCLECTRLDLKTFPKHSATGFGRCPLAPVGSFVNVTLQRKCHSFKPAAIEIVATRMEWSKKI